MAMTNQKRLNSGKPVKAKGYSGQKAYTREDAGVDCDSPWVASCDIHHEMVGCDTKADAKRTASQSPEWCSGCGIEQEDKNLLKYAGWMGHEFITIVGERGERRVKAESSTMSSAIDKWSQGPRMTVYQRKGAKWVRAHKVGPVLQETIPAKQLHASPACQG